MADKAKTMLNLEDQDKAILRRWSEIYGVSFSAMARIILREFDQRNRTETVTTGGPEPAEREV